jgi:hypothetical protein
MAVRGNMGVQIATLIFHTANSCHLCDGKNLQEAKKKKKTEITTVYKY